ncbi:MAG: hypothetical protein GW949_02650 [Spirochaetales bacterium]|nr:hypothetical protein [Spirochaetales bacterium]
MKKSYYLGLSVFFVLFVFGGLLTGCSTTTESGEEPLASSPPEVETPTPWVVTEELPAVPPYPAYSLAPQGGPNQIAAFVPGILIEIAEDNWGGLRAVMEIESSYFWEGQKVDYTYELVFGGLETVDAQLGPLELGDPLGTSNDNSYLVARKKELERNMVRETGLYPFYFAGGWWYQPAWLLPEHVPYLGFRQVPDALTAARDFMAGQEDLPEDFVIGFDPDRDVVRFPLVLESLPATTPSTPALEATEMTIFGQSGMFALSQRVSSDDISADLYWIGGYDEYLTQEATIGDTVWIYGYAYTADIAANSVLIFVREFSTFNDEEVLEVRMEELRAEYPNLEIVF